MDLLGRRFSQWCLVNRHCQHCSLAATTSPSRSRQTLVSPTKINFNFSHFEKERLLCFAFPNLESERLELFVDEWEGDVTVGVFVFDLHQEELPHSDHAAQFGKHHVEKHLVLTLGHHLQSRKE